MCLDCHNGLSDTIILTQLKDKLKNPHYNAWNDTSLSHIFLASVGYNGSEAKDIANKLFHSYIQWKVINGHNITETKNTLNHSVKLQEVFAQEQLCLEQIRKRVRADKIIR